MGDFGESFRRCSRHLHLRTVAAENIDTTVTKGNDYRQASEYQTTEVDVTYPVYDHNASQPVFLVHFPINRLVGSVWGESDLTAVLTWIKRYTAWLEDRARLNRFRFAFLWIVKRAWKDEPERMKREQELRLNPPGPRSVVTAYPDEEWEAPAPHLDSSDANTDGLALKKMIGGGFGIPMHWLSEPEGSTRTTAEAAGLPTFKRFEQRQRWFKRVVVRVLEIAVRVRSDYDAKIDPKAEIKVNAPDVSERDNAALALAANQNAAAFLPLLEKKLISADEFLRLVYRFAGETWPPKAKGNPAKDVAPAAQAAGVKVDAQMGDVKTPGAA
ncbi:MAG: hypothetical protein M5U11_00715 [Anaerolineales bacterium]|nr:hypothetical protein [Anaerolineales bacterium]